MLLSKSFNIVAAAFVAALASVVVTAQNGPCENPVFEDLIPIPDDEEVLNFWFLENHTGVLELGSTQQHFREEEFNEADHSLLQMEHPFVTLLLEEFDVLDIYLPPCNGTNRMLGEEEEEVDGEVEEGDERRLLRLCGRCKSAKHYMKCLKNKCRSRKKTTASNRRLGHDEIHNLANQIRKRRNLRGLQGKGGDGSGGKDGGKDGGGDGAHFNETGLFRRVQDRFIRDLDYAVIKYELDLVTNTKRKRNKKEPNLPKAIFDLFVEEEEVCEVQEFIGECRKPKNCEDKYLGAGVTGCDVSSTKFDGFCMCGDEACGCTGSYKSTRCTYNDHQDDNCVDAADCKALYPNAEAYDCKQHKGGVCYCGPGQVCGCMPEPPPADA